ncbi:hypothetical protein SAMN04488541_10761 [Thermoflexibacter ruber]|uniref:Uncharacterized protein n=1 Tax=Thermoflexibacter ruber TaxID=1003 RepID=A0A1I2JZM6_9BACT|nr:hypothetical protein SAMN04488541_10761 [Thermoflexibacter ruber]
MEKTPNIKAYPQKLEDKQIVFIQENVK